MIGQEVLNNTEIVNLINKNKVVIGEDTITLKELINASREQQIFLEVVQSNYDSLMTEYNKSLNIIDSLKKNALKQIEINNINEKIQALEQQNTEQYKKLLKTKLIKGVLGANIGMNYNVITKSLNNPYIGVNLGFIIKEKNQSLFSVGMSLNSQITFNLSQSIVF